MVVLKGWIKLYRQIVDSDIYKMPPLHERVFLRLIIEANHKDVEIPYREKGSQIYRKKLIKRGERLTSIRNIAEWVAWYERGCLKVPNPKTISSILEYLIQENMIYIYDKGNKKETHYKIVNYDIYQDDRGEEGNTKVTVNKQSMDINKNDKNEKNENKKTNKVFMSDSNEYRLAVYLYKHIVENNPKAKEPNYQTWSKGFDSIIRIDKRDIEEVRDLIKFSQRHTFWHKNILSPDKLRKQYDRLILDMKSKNKTNIKDNEWLKD